jgi:hypothetical protein
VDYGSVDDVTEIWGEVAQWYPDVMAAGDSAYRAWQIEFDRRGLPYRVLPGSVEKWYLDAVIEHGNRKADLVLGHDQRRFRLKLRDDKSGLLYGFAADLATAAGAAGQWLSGARPGEVAAAWPFLGSVALAEARERGDRREARWLSLYENHLQDKRATRLREFVALAFYEPSLRRLWPLGSHWALSFSERGGWPASLDHPVVVPALTPAPRRYLVQTRDHRLLGESDAAGALRLLLAAMPA